MSVPASGTKPLSPALRWAGLIILTVLISGFFLLIHLAAGLMLGPMIAGIIVATRNRGVTIPRPWFAMAQAVLGCMVVGSLNLGILHDIVDHWALMGFSVFSVILVSFGIGALLAWLGVMPGTTALWGSSPGGASTMMLICGSFGADPRLAAFMLYFRVILVAISTSLVAWLVAGPARAPYLPPMPSGNIGATLALIAVSTFLGLRIRIPAAPLLIALFLGGIAQLSGFFSVTTPQWIRVPAYLIIGWSIGLRFTSDVLKQALHSLPAVFLSSLVIVGGCALLAWPVARLAHIDLLSAYLATSPGGLDAIIIISASVHVALPFIIAMQTARMLAVLFLGPLLAKPLGRWLEHHRRPPRHGNNPS
ncbi:AbrB family transcriptional regulator [Oecophyllibacter saccharovorans]|uniref:AbrB family transcriptional regulator n=1 Tax=Oecophyllibacter saccharovorans TaxID=2558360 RepID=A0A506ULA5_9PROT|nr:AbrB family transcriptional regulator [Oecophyllibacter saccharovorans]TPW34119.1 AbrB family transcriptional regulator [Oecophyllibacter saccharovorans]